MPDTRPAKIYVVVKDDLSPGQQLAQATHAAFQLAVQYPSRVTDWYWDSNFLVVLSSPDPLSHVPRIGTRHVIVVEPDYPGKPVTAVAFLPAPNVGRYLSHLPLALREPAMT